jgi:hypothetical protein
MTRLGIGFGSDSAPQSYDPTLHDKLFRLLIKSLKPSKSCFCRFHITIRRVGLYNVLKTEQNDGLASYSER